MNNSRLFAGLAMICACLAPVFALAVTDNAYMGVKYSTKGDIVLGEWTCQCRKAITYAEDNDLPIVIFWGNNDCPHCRTTEGTMAQQEFVDWQKDRGLVMVYTIGGVTPVAEGQKAYSFIKNKSGSIPYMAVYWKGHYLADGSYQIAKFNAPDKTQPKQVIDLIEQYISNYSPKNGATFGFTESDYNRYEAEAGTKSVAVQLVRKSGKDAANEKLLVLGTNGKTNKTYNVSWKAGELTNAVSVAIGSGWLKNEGEQLTLQTVSEKGIVCDTTHITYVAKPVAADNPLWDTDRSAAGKPLACGEWTFDLKSAKALAAKTNGYTLVMVSGSQWCPNCYRFDKNFLGVKNGRGEVLFEKWARDNKIALAVVDVPVLSGGKVDKATLLNPTAFPGPAYTDDNGNYDWSAPVDRSGLGYISRKGIDAKTAADRQALFNELAGKTTSEGGFIRPEDTEDSSCNGYRPRVPCFCLLRADGTCAARMTRFTFPETPRVADRAWFDNYLKRFDEMLALAKADASEVENDSAGKGSVELSANGGTTTATLCAADLRDTYRLKGLTGGAIQQVFVGSGAGNLNPDAQVTVSYWRVTNGVAHAISQASASGRLGDGIAKELTVTENGEYYVQVKARHVGPEKLDAAFNPTNGVANNFTTYAIGASVVAYVPGEGAATGIGGEGGTAVVRLVKGEIYRFDGIDDANCTTVLDPIDDDVPHKYFLAKVGGDEALPVLGGKGRAFAYQVWHPGEVGFSETTKTVTESVNDKDHDWVQVKFRRTGGVSGWVKVRVSLDDEETSLTNYLGVARYELLDAAAGKTSADYEWNDGESDEKTFRVRVLADTIYEGNGRVALKLEVLDSTVGGVEVADGKDKYTLNVTEDDKADVGKATVTRVEPYWGKALTVYAREGEGAKIWAKRIVASDGLAGVEVKSSLSGVTFATQNPRDLEDVYNAKTKKTQKILWWSHREMDEKYLHVKGIPAGKTAKVTLNAYDGFKTVSGSNSVTVVSVADDAPYFATDDVSATIYRYVAFSNTYEVASQQGGALTFAKLSGSLPAGLSVKYDAASKKMAVFGVPTTSDAKKGVKRYEAVYQVTEARPVAGSRSTKKVAGLTIRLTFDVVDPVLAGGAGSKPLNDFFATTRTYADIPLVNPATGALDGTLQLTVPRTGKASAKLLCTLGTIAFASSSFVEMNEENGTLVVRLVPTAKTYSSGRLDVSMTNKGTLTLMLAAWNIVYDGVYVPRFWSKQDSAQAYQGSYVLAMPTNAVEETVEGIAPTGSPYLTLKMTSSSQWNAGKMTWAGVLANGTAVSGTAVLSDADGKSVYLPIVKQSKTDFFSALPLVNADKTVTVPVMQVEEVTVTHHPAWTHVETAKALSNVAWSVSYDLYGKPFEKPTDGTHALRFDGELTSQKYGDLEPSIGPNVVITSGKAKVSGENPDKVTFTLSSAGIVSGSLKLHYLDGVKSKSLSATYKGVWIPGLEGRPAVNGFWTFTDTYNKSNIKRGGAVIVE